MRKKATMSDRCICGHGKADHFEEESRVPNNAVRHKDCGICVCQNYELDTRGLSQAKPEVQVEFQGGDGKPLLTKDVVKPHRHYEYDVDTQTMTDVTDLKLADTQPAPPDNTDKAPQSAIVKVTSSALTAINTLAMLENRSEDFQVRNIAKGTLDAIAKDNRVMGEHIARLREAYAMLDADNSPQPPQG